MTKATITKFFVGGLVAVFAGLFLAIVAVWAAFATGEFVMDGPDVTGVQFTTFGWSMTGLMILGGFAMIGGAIAGLVAWIGRLDQHRAAARQGVVRPAARPRPPELRVHRDARVCHRRPGRDAGAASDPTAREWVRRAA